VMRMGREHLPQASLHMFRLGLASKIWDAKVILMRA
jgi:hypothetical protein